MSVTIHPGSSRATLKGALFVVLGIALAGIGLPGLGATSSAAAPAGGAQAIPSGACPSPSFGPLTSFPAGINPVAVAIADFNLDSHPDIAAADYNQEEVLILLGNGAGSFGSPTSFPVGTGPSGLAVGDFNLDAKPDLAVANFLSNNVSI